MLRLKTFGGLAILAEGRPAGAATQRRRQALLAVIAAAGERGVSRERLVSLFWPDSEEERGRAALAQALYALRRDLGAEELVLGTGQLSLNRSALAADVLEYESALKTGELAHAAALYAGHFLDGFSLPELDEFERWLELERQRLAREQTRCLERLADDAGKAGDRATELRWAWILAAHEPLSGRGALRLMRTLAATGDRSGALQYARVHEALVRGELDVAPDGEVVAYVEKLKGELERADRAEGAVEAERAERAEKTERAERAERAEESSASGSSASASRSGERRTGTSPSTGFGRRSSDFMPDIGMSQRTAEHALPRKAKPAAAPTPVHTSGAPWYRLLDTPLTTPSVRRPRRLPRLYWAGLGVLAGALVLATVMWVFGRSRTTGRRVVAVGQIANLSNDSLPLPIADMLATNLARVPALEVVSNARMIELAPPNPADHAAALLSAARQAGATELVDGTLVRQPDGTLRLDLRRTDLANGRLLASRRVEGANAFELVERATGAVVERGDAVPSGLADVTTRSIVAYRFYEEGLRNFHAGNRDAARRLFAASLGEDSSFAMAQYYAALAALPDFQEYVNALRRALELSERATERERLLIRLEWAFTMEEPNRVMLADSLVTLYPSEPLSHLRLGEALVAAGRFPEAATHFQRAVDLEPVKYSASASGRCVSCDAMGGVVSAWRHADSLERAIRIARQWTQEAPKLVLAWLSYADALMYAGRLDEARVANGKARELAPDPDWEGLGWRLDLFSGKFPEVEQYFLPRTRSKDPDVRADAWWWLAISRRMEGHLNDALAAADSARHTRADPFAHHGGVSAVTFIEGAVRLDRAEYRRAAAIFDSLSRRLESNIGPARMARHKAWTLALEATALALAGDTAALPALADTVEAYGRQSGFGRDQRLHHLVRGLLLEARQRDDEALQALRSSIWSWSGGFTRIQFEMAKILLRQGRASEAIPILRSALRSGIDAGGLYLSRTETEELLAKAFVEANQPDSARAHFQVVATVWANADPVLQPRRTAAAQWLQTRKR